MRILLDAIDDTKNVYSLHSGKLEFFLFFFSSFFFLASLLQSLRSSFQRSLRDNSVMQAKVFDLFVPNPASTTTIKDKYRKTGLHYKSSSVWSFFIDSDDRIMHVL